MYGLNDAFILKLQRIFSRYKQIDKVLIYGSRAKGTARNGSDIDLSLVGENLNLALLYEIDNCIDELDSPYLFDLSLFTQIDNPDLIDHINRVGKVFYQKNTHTL